LVIFTASSLDFNMKQYWGNQVGKLLVSLGKALSEMSMGTFKYHTKLWGKGGGGCFNRQSVITCERDWPNRHITIVAEKA